MENNLTLILLGPQGSGKGTQAEMLVSDYGFSYIAGGDIARNLAKRGDVIGKQVKNMMNSGMLIPNDILMEGLREEMKKNRGKPLLIDGIPRNLEQMEKMKNVFEVFDRVPVTVLIKLDKKVAKDRLVNRKICESCSYMPPYPEVKKMKECPKCGGKLLIRGDDTPEAIEERLEIYERETRPLIEKMKKDRIEVVEVDGSPRPDKVHQAVKIKLGDKLSI